MKVEILRSRRRTMALVLGPDGLKVRAPLWASDREIGAFIRENEDWIRRHGEELERRLAQPVEKLSAEELKQLRKQAGELIPGRVAFYAHQLGVEYGRIGIRSQHTRWGSCSAKGNLSFNCLLMLCPPEVLDSVVVHELCHRREMNHSARFYELVLSLCPDYKSCRAWLRENGPGLLARLPD